MTLGHDDGLRVVKRPSGISPASIVREGKDRPELFLLRSQVPPAEGIEAPVRLGRLSWGCEQIVWLPNPPCHQGVCASTLMGRHKQPPDCIGQTLGSTWRGGAWLRVPWERDHHGKASVSALGLKEGVGFYPQ
jgi:hypothetical protein